MELHVGYYMELKQTRNTLSDFRSNLFGICPSLSDKDVKDLVYLSPEAECPEDIQGGREYFDQLERKGLISPSNYAYLLDRLTQIKKEDLAMQLMKYSCQSQHTPRSLSTHLFAHFLDSGKEDLIAQTMRYKLSVPRLSRGLSGHNQTFTKVCAAKQDICTAHIEAVTMLSDTDALNAVRLLLQAYLCQSILQSTKTDMDASIYQWSSSSEFEDRGTLGELLENTLESVYSFADAFYMNIGTVLNMETIQLQSIEPSARACSLAFDRFSEALADSEWNHGARQDAIDRKTGRVFQIDIQGKSACKAIADICEGPYCGKNLEEAESLAKEELFTINTSMYACWYSTPMLHWMRTLIQMAASSKLDLTKYHDLIIKIVSVHREPIIKCYSIFTQLLGKDVMKMVDPVLNVPQDQLSERPNTTDNCTMVEYMTVYFYMYLLQLVALTGSSSSSQWEMAERFANIHQEFHENYYAEALKSSMEVARKIITATCTQVENFKQQAIQLCPNSSAERFLLSKVLSISK